MRGKFNCISKHFGKITLNEKDDAPRKHIEVDIRERWDLDWDRDDIIGSLYRRNNI